MTNRQAIREKRRREKQRRRLTTILITTGGALVVAAILIFPSVRPIGSVVEITPRDIPNPDGRAMGDPNAPIVLEEFSDFQCPACRVWSDQTETVLMERYIQTGDVYFVYRHFPFLDNRVATNESDQAANASMCAGEQNMFWAYHDLLFANQTGENVGAFSDRRLTAYAESLGLDMTAFNRCFRENQFGDEINADTNRGLELGVNATPSIALNGQLMESNSLEFLEGQIQALLAAAGQ